MHFRSFGVQKGSQTPSRSSNSLGPIVCTGISRFGAVWGLPIFKVVSECSGQGLRQGRGVQCSFALRFFPVMGQFPSINVAGRLWWLPAFKAVPWFIILLELPYNFPTFPLSTSPFLLIPDLCGFTALAGLALWLRLLLLSLSLCPTGEPVSISTVPLLGRALTPNHLVGYSLTYSGCRG